MKYVLTLVILLVTSFSFAMDVVIVDDFSNPSSHGNKVKSNVTNSKLTMETFDISSKQDRLLYYQALENTLKIQPKVLNLSLGGLDYDYKEADLLRQISDAGTFIVVAAGNHGRRLLRDTMVYPCALKIERLICVGALEKDLKTEKSNFGPPVKFFMDGSFKEENATSYSAPKVSQLVAEIIRSGVDPEFVLKQSTILIDGSWQWVVKKEEVSQYLYNPSSARDPF